jgi:hypothetical protein
VGTGAGQVRPGRYATTSVTDCTWQRLRSQSGPDNVIAEGGATGQAVVDVVEGDAFFTSTDCGTWAEFLPPTQQVAQFGSGQWVVGDEGTGQIAPGSYRTNGASNCEWQTLRGFDGDPDQVIDSGQADQPTTVDVGDDATGFSSTGCPTWTKVG